MDFSLRQVQCMQCSLCGKLILDGSQETTEEAILFGSVKYSICPICFQEVVESDQTEEYKEKYDVFLEKRKR